MCSLRRIVMVLIGLPSLVSCLAAGEPEGGKLRLVHWFKNPDDKLADYAFSADGKVRIVGNNKDGSVSLRVWDPEKDKEIARYSVGPKKFADGITMSPDGKLVACSYDRKELFVFDVISGKTVASTYQPGGVQRPRFTPDGKGIIIDSDGYRLWDFRTGKDVWCLRLWETAVGFAFALDGKTLAACLRDGSVQLYNAATGAKIRRLFRPSSKPEIPSIAFSLDGRYLASHAFEDFRKEVRSLTLTNRLVIRVWEVRSGELVRELRQPFPPLTEPGARMRDLFNDRELFTQKYDRNSWGGLAFSPDGKTIVNSSGFITQLWEVASGRVRHEPDSIMAGVRFSPDGRMLVASSCIIVPNKPGKDWLGKRGKWDGIRLWDWRDPCLKQPKVIGSREIDELWDKLSSPDARVGYQAIATLLAHPRAAVAALKQRLKRVEPLAPSELGRLLANLDADEFAARERASQRLAALGEAIRPALLREKERGPSLEVRRRIEDLLPRLWPAGSPDRLRCLRAVEVLESIGTEEARLVMKRLASGADGSIETEDAKAALKRLKRK